MSEDETRYFLDLVNFGNEKNVDKNTELKRKIQW